MARSKKTEETHFFANDGTDWKTQPSPVDLEEKIKADKALDEKARQGDGPAASNEPR